VGDVDDGKNSGDLLSMYKLFSKITCGLDLASSLFKQCRLHFLSCSGAAIYFRIDALVKQVEVAASEEKAKKFNMADLHGQGYVKKVLELHDKYFAYVHNCFSKHILFAKVGVGEYIGWFVISVKRTFLTFFEVLSVSLNFLAQRLLSGNSANIDFERGIVIELRARCGDEEIGFNMLQMFTDLIKAREDQIKFEEYLTSNPHENPGIDFTAMLLHSTFWLGFNSLNLNLPGEMVKCMEVFQNFINTDPKKRKLEWMHSLGTCNVIGTLGQNTFEPIVTTFQACLLLLFNTADRLSYSDIKGELKLTDEIYLSKVLHSLSSGKYKILNKEPNTVTILPTDTFEINAQYTSKLQKIKIPCPPMHEKKNVVENDGSGKFAIDASIVRIMKSRRSLIFQQLSGRFEVCISIMLLSSSTLTMTFLSSNTSYGTLEMQPDTRTINIRIDYLIQRGYLVRDEEDRSLCKYLAYSV
ncbi:hypothetical protein IFM89_030270, partial [Coptis chinensis]